MMMKIHGVYIVLVSLVSVFVIANCLSTEATLGGVSDSNGNPNNGGDAETIARYAIDEHNKKENTNLVFVKVLQNKEQVVSGKIYNLVVEATDGGKINKYAARVLVKPWMNFKQLQAFSEAPDNV